MTNTQSNDGWPAHFRGPRPTLKATDLNSLDPQSQWHIPGAEKIGDLTHMFKVYPGAVGVRALPIAPLYSCAEKLTWKDKGEPVAIWRDRPRDWTYDDKQRCNVRRSNRNILQDRLELICQIEGGPNSVARPLLRSGDQAGESVQGAAERQAGDGPRRRAARGGAV